MPINAKAVGFAYASRSILADVNLELRGGELLGLAGPNGAGKTTLLKILTGYLRPNTGQVLLQGDDLQTLSRRETAQRVALVPQTASTSFPYLVHELVLMGRHAYSGLGFVPAREDLDRVYNALEQVGISTFAERRYDRLSGGEQRLVILARALAQDTPVLLLDEPLSALDLHHQWQVLRLLQDLRNRGIAIVATFHDLNIAAQWCTRVALMYNGRLVATGAPAEVFRKDLLQQV